MPKYQDPACFITDRMGSVDYPFNGHQQANFKAACARVTVYR
jgi:hypothetical protein